jgi:hypothetical protein
MLPGGNPQAIQKRVQARGGDQGRREAVQKAGAVLVIVGVRTGGADRIHVTPEQGERTYAGGQQSGARGPSVVPGQIREHTKQRYTNQEAPAKGDDLARRAHQRRHTQRRASDANRGGHKR